MFLNDESDALADTVDLLLTELGVLRSSGPRFIIVHRFQEAGYCAPGEEVAAVYLAHRSAEVVVPLSVTLRILFDFLAKHSRFPQSASQIAAAIAVDPFYRNHGANAPRAAKLDRKISRVSIKEFICRIRYALDAALRSANLAIDVKSILVSEPTMMNEVGYRLKATFEWIHIDYPD
jgi:hypothetical protein